MRSSQTSTSYNAPAAGHVAAQAAAVEPSFAVPIVLEFIEAQTMVVAANHRRGFNNLRIPMNALFSLPPIARDTEPRFPDSVVRHAYRPGLGTGFFEPRMFRNWGHRAGQAFRATFGMS